MASAGPVPAAVARFRRVVAQEAAARLIQGPVAAVRSPALVVAVVTARSLALAVEVVA